MLTVHELQKDLTKFMDSNLIRKFGVCNFNSVLPLIECGAKRHLPQNPKSCIVFTFPYLCDQPNQLPKDRNISLYAAGNDYHCIIIDILSDIVEYLSKIYPENNFACFCDNSPINEVKAAALCGLGDIGCNTLLITKEYGSFVFIGEIVTDLEIETEEVEIKECIKCKKCEELCVSGSINLKNGFDKKICASFLSQKKKDLSDFEISVLKKCNSVWGCDECQLCCPYNKNVQLTYIKEFYKNVNYVVNKENVNENFDNKAYNYRGIDVIKRNIDLLNNE